jgi:hypothetical protein
LDKAETPARNKGLSLSRTLPADRIELPLALFGLDIVKQPVVDQPLGGDFAALVLSHLPKESTGTKIDPQVSPPVVKPRLSPESRGFQSPFTRGNITLSGSNY